LIKEYLEELLDTYGAGTREEGFYPVLKSFIEKLYPSVNVYPNPKKVLDSFPDFKITDREKYIIGYIEAKSINEDLDKYEYTEQIKRYKESFKNFILTNFLEFRHYLNGNLHKKIVLANFSELKKGSDIKNIDKLFLEFKDLFNEFINYSEKPIKNLKELATNLAWKVKILKSALLEESKKNENLRALYNNIKKYIIHTLKEEDFADTIAQSLVYGTLITSLDKKIKYTPSNKWCIVGEFPENLDTIQEIFIETLRIKDKNIQWALDEVINTLSLLDLENINITSEDITTYFYEPFLKAYNPELREAKGVYYTPREVVNFINKSVDFLLKDRFNKKEGLASSEIKLLDPSAGTLTFILDVLYRVKEYILKRKGEGHLREHFNKYVLNNFYAFEILPAPYVIGHLRVSNLLSRLGIDDIKFKLYLTNTLEKKHKIKNGYLFSNIWAKENIEADRVKEEEDILVIVGNPPYSAISENRTKEIIETLKDEAEGCQSYYKVDNKDLLEFMKEVSRTTKLKTWIQDDYIKFLRFAQCKINKTGKGVIGFVLNHSFIDNPTFAGVRQSLLKTFDKIYILDLHGNKRKNEEDENIFDISQGVCIAIFIKDNTKEKGLGDVFYYSTLLDEKLRKKREKLEFLDNNDIKTIKWKKVDIKTPYYLFKPLKLNVSENSISITKIFNKKVSGVITARDKLAIAFTKKELVEKIKVFIGEKYTDEEIRIKFFKRKKTDTREWELKTARKNVRNLIKSHIKLELNKEDKEAEELLTRYLNDEYIEDEIKETIERAFYKNIKPILYRPFDIRYIFYHECMIDWKRKLLEENFVDRENIGLILPRQVKTKNWQHRFISKIISESSILSNYTSEIAYIFPLYIYKNRCKEVNLIPDFEKFLDKIYPNKNISEREILAYIYGVLFSPNYRKNYEDILKIEFPYIPFTKNIEEFFKIVELGDYLIRLHTLEKETIEDLLDKEPFIKFEPAGSNKVSSIKYDKEQKKLYINEKQYFYPVKPSVMEYKIGAYNVIEKWLKERVNRKLTIEDLEHITTVIKVLEETIKIEEKLKSFSF